MFLLVLEFEILGGFIELCVTKIFILGPCLSSFCHISENIDIAAGSDPIIVAVLILIINLAVMEEKHYVPAGAIAPYCSREEGPSNRRKLRLFDQLRANPPPPPLFKHKYVPSINKEDMFRVSKTSFILPLQSTRNK